MQSLLIYISIFIPYNLHIYSGYQTVTIEDDVYYINFCKKVKGCKGDAQPSYSIQEKGFNGCLGIGQPDQSKMSLLSETDPFLGAMLENSGGEPYIDPRYVVDRRSRIKVYCDKTASPITVPKITYLESYLDQDVTTGKHYRTFLFEMKSPFACPGYSTGSSSGIAEFFGFSVFALLFFLALFLIPIAYLIIGVIVNAAIRKKRTFFEIIPNWTFWKEIPFLIKDGVLLIVLGCKLCVTKIKNRRGNYEQVA